MTREEAKRNSENSYFKAFADGKKVQWKNQVGEWQFVIFWNFHSFPDTEFRIKPEPKLRPWKPEEVPVGCVVRKKEYTAKGECYHWLLTSSCPSGVHFGELASNDKTDFIDLLVRFEHSLDHGKTWLPCGVTEE